MITAQLACTQMLENGGEGADRYVALVLVIARRDGADNPQFASIPAASLTITVTGKAADRFEVGKVYELNISERAQ